MIDTMILALMLSTLIAQASSPVQAYHAYLRPRFQAFGVAGELKLTLTPDGYVNGTYRAQTGGRIEPVHGGHKGDRIWFDYGGVHVEGSMKDGAISGLGSTLGPGAQAYVFTAKPETAPSP